MYPGGWGHRPYYKLGTRRFILVVQDLCQTDRKYHRIRETHRKPSLTALFKSYHCPNWPAVSPLTSCFPHRTPRDGQWAPAHARLARPLWRRRPALQAALSARPQLLTPAPTGSRCKQMETSAPCSGAQNTRASRSRLTPSYQLMPLSPLQNIQSITYSDDHPNPVC